MVKFLSEEWITFGKQFMLEKIDPVKDLKNLTTSLLCVIENVPPNETTMNLYLEFQQGKLTDLIVNTSNPFTEKEAVFVITGLYGTYKDIIKGNMSLSMALLKNRLKLKGSKIEALKLLKPIDVVINSLQKITNEFEE
ncbi:MAG: SCP2 sterol-binding domain-containing protein [Candidatus Thermoplasmatota archaeon]|nr:SCP2 sterol-binding domain-containing protein [Candidatus Thermoplasmatota archaeon]